LYVFDLLFVNLSGSLLPRCLVSQVFLQDGQSFAIVAVVQSPIAVILCVMCPNASLCK